MDRSLTIRLGPELGDALEEAARKAGISKGELARQAGRAPAQAQHSFGDGKALRIDAGAQRPECKRPIAGNGPK